MAQTGTTGPAGRLLTVLQAAEVLNTSPRFVRRLVEERRIPFHKLGRHVRITEADLAAFIAATRIDPTHPGRAA